MKRQNQNTYLTQPHYRTGEAFPYLGIAPLLLQYSDEEKCTFTDNQLIITCPYPNSSAKIGALVLEFKKERTAALVTNLCRRYYPYFKARGVKYPDAIRFKSMRTRWASCSSAGYLNFNIHLIDKPIEFIEYVVVHELCHFLVPNHSPAFYREVEKILPDYRERLKLNKRSFSSY